jgi:sulfopyruvate decarboxylase alpha subunit
MTKITEAIYDTARSLDIEFVIDQRDEIKESTNLDTERKIISFLNKNNYNFGVTFPCSKFENLFNMLKKEKKMHIIPVTREEEGIGVSSGAYLAGKKPFMVIQSSGLGNSFNAIASLLITYEIPILIIASYRGIYKEKIPAQVPLGLAISKMLNALKIPFIIVKDDLEGIESFCKINHSKSLPYVALISPELF